MDLFERIIELSRQGFFCAQILVILGMDTDGKDNPELVRAMGGLSGGLGFTGNICGCLTGGCCLLSYFLGKGEAEEMEDPETRTAISDYVNWFKTKADEECGGDTCLKMTGNDPGKRMELCPGLIAECYEKCIELLSERGVL